MANQDLKEKKRKGARGQSILEYSVIFVVVVSVIIVIVPIVFRPKVTDVYNKTGNILDTGIVMMDGIGGGPVVANNATP